MNILLIIPQFKYEYKGKMKSNYYFPLGIAYISSYLKNNGIRVFTFNGALYYKEECKEILCQMLRENDIELVGIGGLTGEYCNIKYYAELIRKEFPYLKIVIGGGFVTSHPKLSMSLIDEADFGIIGEGEYVFLDLIKRLKINKNLSCVSNLIYRYRNSLIVTGKSKKVVDIDILPFPDYEGFCFDNMIETNEKYLGKRIAPIIASRSCPFKCTFCFHPSGEIYRKRNLNNVIEEIKWLQKKYKINYITITDELFVDDIEYLKCFCEFMKKNMLDWDCCARVNNITEEILKIMKEGRCVRIYYGLESADNLILKSMCKGIDNIMITNALNLTRKAGIQGVGSFIFGDVKENKNTVNNSLYYYSTYKEFAIDLNLLRVFPGTKVYEYALEKGVILDEKNYIENGCPNINISELAHEDYVNLKFELENAKSKKVLLPFKINKIKKEKDNIKICYFCRNCLKNNEVTIFKMSELIECFCKMCSEYHHFSIIDVFRNKINNKFKDINKNYNNIVLISINNTSLRMYYNLENKENVKFYDSRYAVKEFPICNEEYLVDDRNLLILCSHLKSKLFRGKFLLLDKILEDIVLDA